MNHNTTALIAALENAPAIAISLIREVPPEYLKRRPSPAKWSVHEHACHLAGSDGPFLARLDLMLSVPHPAIRSIVVSPDDESGGLLGIDLDEALERYTKERASLVRRLKGLSEADWRRTAEHEAFREYSVWIMFRHLLTHEMLHVYRIEELQLRKDWD